MKPRLPWHKTPLGRVACYLGSIKPAIPILFALAAALAYGTYIESTESAKLAKHLVYGSWWFIALLIYTALSLTFAVVIRYPWSKKHIGFITVHIGIITVITGAFISSATRIEGTITLQEGMTANQIDTDNRQLEHIEIPQTKPIVVGTHNIPDHFNPSSNITFDSDGLQVRLVEQWENSRSKQIILDDAATPLEAIEYTTDPQATTGQWLGETRQDDPRSKIAGIQLRIFPVNSNWKPTPVTNNKETTPTPTPVPEPKQTTQQPADHIFFNTPDGKTIEVTGNNQNITPDWKITQVKIFRHATVGKDGLIEGDHATDNPAVQIILENTKDGSLERNISFARYPDMKIARPIEGNSKSDLTLHYEHHAENNNEPSSTHPNTDDQAANRIVFQNNLGKFKATWVRKDGSVKDFNLDGKPPYTIDLDGTKLIILKHYTHARAGEIFTRAPKADANLPVLIIEVKDGYLTKQLQIAWKSSTPYFREGEARPNLFRFGPKHYPVPFTLQLLDFRKKDYPGSQMAMAYESDVLWQPGRAKSQSPMGIPSINKNIAKKQKIWMNNPLKYDGWKVYQSGFMGDSVSTFSVMKDPGLWPTYVGCIILCLGILVIFYTPYSHGHPGIAKHAKKTINVINDIPDDKPTSRNPNRKRSASRKRSKKGVTA